MSVNIEEIPYQPDSAVLFKAIAREEWPVWLDSGQGFPGHDVDILAARPVSKLIYDPEGTINAVSSDITVTGTVRETFAQVEHLLAEHRHCHDFGPGWFGYLSYDLFSSLESTRKVRKRQKTELIPGIVLGFYSTVIVNHHDQKKTRIYSLPCQQAWANRLAERIIGGTPAGDKPSDFVLEEPFSANTNRETYREQFKRVQDYILSGDCYQVNLTQQFSARCSGDSSNAFLALRQAHPSPMSAYFGAEYFDIISLSPERFLQKKGRRIASYPIKGTRPRSNNPVEDERHKAALQSSLKDRAENVMIVDLLRNDLGRICKTGSISADRLFAIESFPNVHHLVSAIEGVLSNNVTLENIINATFPGGSITGAPKIRAMEIIEELEEHRRSIYCGSMVYLGGNGDFDSSIAIRTLLRKNREIYCWGGGGVVADSVCDSEYQETLDKVGKLMGILEDRFSPST